MFHLIFVQGTISIQIERFVNLTGQVTQLQIVQRVVLENVDKLFNEVLAFLNTIKLKLRVNMYILVQVNHNEVSDELSNICLIKVTLFIFLQSSEHLSKQLLTIVFSFE